MSRSLFNALTANLDDLRRKGLYKEERVLSSAQGPEIEVQGGRKVLNFCANNYLGLSADPRLSRAASAAMGDRGFGLSSVRFICGTQDLHKELEAGLSSFLGMEDSILYTSCFDANGGLFEALLGPEDAIISDALNHASIIDGVRLCKAKRYVYANNDMAELEARLREAAGARYRLIATDGVFSMDGVVADLAAICDLADRYDALVMVDDSHAVGFLGDGGRGTPEYRGAMGRVDILTGTLGKALGGAAGGYVAARKEVVAWLRQRSRPYLFSNSLPPALAAAGLETLRILKGAGPARARLRENAAFFRAGLSARGLDVLPGEHPIVPLMLYDARIAVDVSARLLEKGVYAIAFSYPVVPEGKARIRFQVSAAHTRDQLSAAVEAVAAAVAEARAAVAQGGSS